MMRPPSMTETTRLTRRWAMPGSHSTSTNWVPKEWVEKPRALGSEFMGPELPSPLAAWAWAILRIFSKAMPVLRGWVLMWPFPSENSSQSAVLPWKGELAVAMAVEMATLTAL